ncbi:signal transducer and activator of transcription [Plakobranchus ocellatus]|uniref:Signal transducer and activator of transcription n=1 Tax=Plakobranchus ocellatus TaxID=259542 RepID=A0AAV3Z4W9_9GAST|nr:signal transducer and activator of transcription [Plakobranchus ocellatus]
MFNKNREHSYENLLEVTSQSNSTCMMNMDSEDVQDQVGASSQQESTTMSQWAKVQQNPNVFRQMSQFYPPTFPMEIRFYLCGWIEEQRWSDIDETNPQFVPIAQKTLLEMLELVRHRAKDMTSQDFFIIKLKLEELVEKLDGIVKTNPLELIQVIKRCLAMEQQLIEQAEKAEQQQMTIDCVGVDQSGIGEKILKEIQSLTTRTKMTENDLRDLQHSQESFILRFSDSQKVQAQITQLSQMPLSIERTRQESRLKTEKEEIDRNLGQLAQQLQKLRIELARKYQDTIKSLQELQKEILDNELITWKRRQQMAGNGLVMDIGSLETLQHWCESLAELVWQNRHQIKKSTQLQEQLPIKCESLAELVWQNRHQIKKSTQLQEQLPIKFADGEENILPKLNDTITGLLSSLVTSTFIVEQQPPQVLKKDARFAATVRLLVGGKLNVYMNPPQVKATIISESQAKDLLRNEVKTKDDTSGDILNNSGTMEYQQTNGQLSVNFRNMQLKKIKRADKKGSEAVTEEKFCILFQSEFSVGGNELVFQVWTLSLPVVVTVHGNQECNATATVLWDNAFAEAGRIPFVVPDQVAWSALADQLNMKFMSYTGKGLSETNLSYIASKLFGDRDPTSCMVTWSQFNKNKTIVQLSSLMGSSGKQSQGENNNVWNLSPFTAKDFQIRGAADRIKDLNSLVYLFPNRAKSTVFGKYYTSPAENISSNGYIRPSLKTTLPDQFAPGSDMEMMRQPFSPEEVGFDENPGSVPVSIEGLSLSALDISTDQMPADFEMPEIDDVSINNLLQDHLLQYQ